MSAASRRKGATAERDVVAWLKANGFPYAERRAGGTPGPDITGCPGIAWEIKNAARLELAAWVDQAEAQRAAGGADVGPVVIKRKGTTDPGRWYAVLPLADLTYLLRETGYGAAPERERKHQVLLLSGPDSGLLATGSTQLAVWHAKCSCGWHGPERLTQAEACDDWLDHVPPAEIDLTVPVTREPRPE